MTDTQPADTPAADDQTLDATSLREWERQAAEQAKRGEWAAAYRDAADHANAHSVPAIRSFAHFLADRADSIERGDFTPEPSTPPAGSCGTWAPELGPCIASRPCPVHDQPSTPPAQPAHTARAAAGGHPGTLDGPGVLGRALLDRDGDLWQPAEEHQGREVLLVDPAAWERRKRVLDAARVVADGQQQGTPEWLAALRAMAAAVDAYDRPTANLVTASRGLADRPTTGGDLNDDLRWLVSDKRAEPAPAVVRCSCGAAITHATTDGYGRDGCDDPVPADHQQLHEALAEAEQRADAAEDRMVTASAERQWAVDGVCRRCGHGLHAEPAPEPAGDGPGWERSNIDAIIEGWNLRGVSDGSQETLTNLLADRDHWAKVSGKWADETIAARNTADAARAELATAQATLARFAGGPDEVRAELAKAIEERDLAIAHDRQPYPTADAYELVYAALERKRAELAEVTAELAQTAADNIQLRADRDSDRRSLDEVVATNHQLAAELAEVTAERDRLHGVAERAMSERREATAEVAEARAAGTTWEELLATARRDAAAEWKPRALAAEQELARVLGDHLGAVRQEVRREGAADALEEAANDASVLLESGARAFTARGLRARAAITRAGSRPVPGSPEPAGEVHVHTAEEWGEPDDPRERTPAGSPEPASEAERCPCGCNPNGEPTFHVTLPYPCPCGVEHGTYADAHRAHQDDSPGSPEPAPSDQPLQVVRDKEGQPVPGPQVYTGDRWVQTVQVTMDPGEVDGG